MGATPGFVMWRAVGRKVMDIGDVPTQMRKYIEETQPNYFDSGRPWEGTASTYRDYMKVRRPAKPK